MKLTTICKNIYRFITVSRVETHEWTCSIGCHHIRDVNIPRWYVKLLKDIKYKIARTYRRLFWPKFSWFESPLIKQCFPSMPLFDTKDVKIIPMTEPTGLKFAMKYLVDKDNKKPLDNNLGEARD